MHGENQHSQVRHNGHHILNKEQAHPLSQGNIQNHSVRSASGNGIQSLWPTGSLGAHLKPLLPREKKPYTLTHNRMVIHK